MSDTENGAGLILEEPHGGSLSSQQDFYFIAAFLCSSLTASTFALFKDYFDKKLTALKRDIQEDSLSNIDSIAKKLKEESKISFKFVGIKKQFCFNSGLAEKVHAASTALGKRKLEVVRCYLEELDSYVKKRNKLIRLTDKSAAGWHLVNEYLSDELASGSEAGRKAHSTCIAYLVYRAKGPSQTKRSSTTEREILRSSSRSFTAIGKAKPGD